MSQRLRVIVAGSRTVKDYMAVRGAMLKFLSEHPNTDVVWITGRASEGPDDMAYHFAKWDVKGELLEVPADWDSYGRSAGFRRNSEMAELGDRLLLVWDGRSNGSAHMRECMRKLGKPIQTYVVDVESQAGDYELFDFRHLPT